MRKAKARLSCKDWNYYFVDATLGSDSNTGRSSAAPWQTLAKINAHQFHGGDRVLLNRGEIFTNATSQYALVLSQGVVLDAYGTGNDPVIVGNGTDLNAYCIHLAADNCKVKNIKLTTAREGAVYVTGDGCEIANCEMTATGTGARIVGANCLFHDNNVHNLKMVVSTVGGNDDYGAVGAWLFTGCNGSRIYNNTFEYCEAYCEEYGVDGGAVEIYGTVDDVKVYNNFALHCSGFIEFGAPNAESHTASNIKVYNNIVSQC